MDIGSLTGEIELEDRVSSVLTNVMAHVRQFSDKFDGALKGIAVGAGAVSAAVIGIAGTVIALGSKGSTILGVEDAFDRLAKQAGTTGDALIGGLNKGLLYTVDSMVEMQSVNRALTAGVKLTEADMELLGSAARAMGKATGTDAAQGLDTLSSALTTGRTKGLAAAGMVVDVKKAEEALAHTLGTTADALSNAGKLQAARNAILEATRGYVDRLGTSELTLKERVQQVAVAVGNWFDNLAKGVAQSSHVTRAFDAIKASILNAFGGSSETLLATVVGWINRFADAAATYGPKIISVVADIKEGIVKVWHAVQEAWNLVPDWFKNVARDAALAGGAVFLAGKAFTALGGSNLLTTAASIGTISSGLIDVAKAIYAFVPATALLVKTSLATGALSGTLGLLALGLAQIVIPIAAVTAVLKAGSVAWDLWGQSSQKAHDAAWQASIDQRVLAEANKYSAEKITDTAKAMDFLRQRAKELQRGPGYVPGITGFQEMLAEQAAARAAADRDALINQAELEKRRNEIIAANLKVDEDQRIAHQKWVSDFANRAGMSWMAEDEKRYKDQQDAFKNNLDVMEELQKSQHATRAASADTAGLRALDESKRKYQEVEQYATRSLNATAIVATRAYDEIKARSAEFGKATIQHFKDVADAAKRASIDAQGGWRAAYENIKDVLKSIPEIISKSFTGGGGLSGAFKAIGTQLYDVIMTPLLKGLTEVQQKVVAAASGISSALGGKVGGQTGAMVTGIASSLGGAAIAASAWGIHMANAGVAGSLALSGVTLGIGAAVIGVIALVKHFGAAQRVLKAINDDRDKFTDTIMQSASAEVLAAANGQKWAVEVLSVRETFLKIGRSAPEAQAALERLWNAKTPQAYAAAVAEISSAMSVVNTMTGAMDKLTAAEDKYHFTATANGSALYESYQLLLASQRGEEDILRHMHDDFQQLIRDAIEHGTILPLKLKDPISKLLEMGEITLEDGRKLKDINEITFGAVGSSGETAFDRMTAGVDRFVAAVKLFMKQDLTELERRLLGLPALLSPVSGGSVGGGDAPTYDPENPYAPSFSTVAGMSVGGADSAANSASRPQTLVVEIDRRKLAEWVVPEIPGVTDRFGLR